MALNLAGQKRLHQFGAIGVVENQQPAFFSPQPYPHRLHGFILVFGILQRQVEGLGDTDIATGQLQLRIGPHPKHIAIVVAIAVGILHRRLGFANAPQPANRLGLRNRCCLPLMQLPVQRRQHPIPPGEIRVPAIGHRPQRLSPTLLPCRIPQSSRKTLPQHRLHRRQPTPRRALRPAQQRRHPIPLGCHPLGHQAGRRVEGKA